MILRLFRRLASTAAALAVFGILPAAAAETLPAGTLVEHHAYGAGDAERLDVYRLPGTKAGPVILMVHGGAWMVGDKSARGVVEAKAAHWLPRGYVFISVNYPLLPAADPLSQAMYVADALAYVQGEAKTLGADPARIVLMGHSSGGHLVDLLTAAPEIAAAEDARPWLGTVSLDAGAIDVPGVAGRSASPLYVRAFGRDPAFWRKASPMDRLTRAPAPMLLVCSSRRIDSCPANQAFTAKARGLGGKVTVAPVALSHMEINDRLGLPGPYTDTVDRFLQSLGLP